MQPVVSLDHIWSAQFAAINVLWTKCEKMRKDAEDKDVLGSNYGADECVRYFSTTLSDSGALIV